MKNDEEEMGKYDSTRGVQVKGSPRGMTLVTYELKSLSILENLI